MRKSIPPARYGMCFGSIVAAAITTGLNSLGSMNAPRCVTCRLRRLETKARISDYFAFFMARVVAAPRRGVAGTPFVEQGTRCDYRFTNIGHVSGACQLFRRKCVVRTPASAANRCGRSSAARVN
jgi:hypothetical protein